jgi:glucose-1-phosphate thymidylyltransferase
MGLGVKGVILAGGFGTRLAPLTRITNKHLLPVYDRPMIYHAVECLVAAGLERILIVTGGNHAGEFLPLLGNGSQFGLKHLDYTFQDRAGGIAEALGLAAHFVGDDDVCVLLADNIFEFTVRGAVERFQAQGGGARLLLARVDDPRQYGVARFDGDRLAEVVEKPTVPPSNLAVAGCYFYDSAVFDIVSTLSPSGRGELEITDVNNAYIARGALRWERVEGYWADCGESIDALLAVQQLVARNGANKPIAAPAETR